jgi:Coenzyme PQQ synthesis protein D (PqqD)
VSDILTERAFQRIDEVVQREVAGEVFLVPIRGHLADLQELFVLNEVGRWLWDRLDGRTGLDDLAKAVTAEFEVDVKQARRDAELFILRLAEAGLVKESLPSEA